MAELPLFVGGPWHGRRQRVARDGETPPGTVMVPRPMPSLTIADFDNPAAAPLDPFAYQLRWYTYADSRMACYFNADTSEYGQGSADVSTRDRALADALLGQDEHDRLPTCVVPDCAEKAPLVFVADEYGRLAGQYWKPGDKIRTCPEHGADIYRAQGVYGRDELAEWLRADTMLDPLDAFDAGTDLLYGREIAERRARALRLLVTAGAGRG